MFRQILEKTGLAGTWLSALSCAACFPLLGTLGATMGLGVLSQFEGVAINTLLPIFASVALIGNAFNWWQHKQHWRGMLSVLAPIAVLLTLYPLWQYGWSTYLFYVSLMLMLVMSLLDIFTPARPPQCQI
jgi:mercuric ion transport protein